MPNTKPLTGYPSVDKPWLKYYDEEARNYPLPEETAHHYLLRSNEQHPADIAINYYGKKISHSELRTDIETVAQALAAAGVKKGDTVTICSVTIPEVICLFYALNKIGAVANMIDPRVNAERFTQILKASDCKLLFCLDLIYEKVESIIQKANIAQCVIISATSSLPLGLKLLASLKQSKMKSRCIYWNAFLKQRASGSVETVVYTPNYPAAIVYTGGTTGVPKGAILTNDNFNAMAEAYKKCIPPKDKRGQKILNIMPPFIAYGLVTGIHMPLSVGAVNILIPRFNPKDFPKLLKKHRPQHTLGVPSHYSILLNNPEMSGVDLSFWVNPAVGGDSMNSTLEERLNDFLKEHNCKSRITKGYGMTELSGTAISSSFAFNKYESVGIPFSKNNVGSFAPGTDEELPYGEIGEICITSPTMFLGYLNEEENQYVKKQHKDGTVWIHSQDYGYIDEDGFVFIKGRIKRTLVRPDGHNNYPMEMESVLNTHPDVADSAVVGFAAERFGNGQIPVAFVVLRDKKNGAELEKVLLDYCKEKLPQRDIPCGIVTVDELPVTNIGKVDHKKLEEQLNAIISGDTARLEQFYRAYEDTLVIR